MDELDNRTWTDGHSRDHRQDRPQVVLAVATDAEGVPIHIPGLLDQRPARQGMGMLKERGEVPGILRRLQTIRVGVLTLCGATLRTSLTQIPKPLNDLLAKLGLLHLFASPPAWALL